MNRFLLSLVCLAALSPLRADEATDRKDIVSKAREMINATFRGDFTGVLKYTHPCVYKLSGGEENMKKAIEGVVEQMKGSGLEFVSMDAMPPEKFFTNGDKTFTVVKTITVMQVPGKVRVTENGAMLAIRETPSGDWTFLRVNEVLHSNRELLKQLLPDVPDTLVLDKPVQPKVEPLGK